MTTTGCTDASGRTNVLCSLVVTCWERAGLLALFYVMLSCVFVTFLGGVLDQVCNLIAWIHDHCLLPFLSYAYVVAILRISGWTILTNI